jgi:transposase
LRTRWWWCALDGVLPVLAADGVTDVAYRRARAEQAEARGGQSEAWVMELSELVVQAEVRAAELAERLTQAEARAAELGGRVAELGEQVTVLSRLLYGEKSEKAKSRPAPGGGGGEGGEAGRGGGLRRRRGQQPGTKGHGRRDYSRLETREEVHDVPEGERVCPHCGKAFELLGTAEDSEQVDWRVTVTRIVHRRLRYRRRCDCPGARTVTAPVVPKPVPKGRFTAAFLARLMFEKYVLGMPLHRTARALAAEGLEVPDGTLCGALREVAPLLAPLEQAVAARNAEAAHLHADETGWRVFEQVPGKDGHRWWLWVFLAPDTTVFAMDPHRSAAVLERHLGIDRKEGEGEASLPEGHHLLLSSDFFTVYQALGRVGGIDPLWCLAHVRRYFVRAGDAHAQLRPWREVWLRRIGEVYVTHHALAAAAPGGPAHTRAQAAYRAAWAALDTARRADAAIYSLHPAAKKVLATLDHEWEGLVRHRDHPDLDLDNNAAERALRTPVVGRKNYYGNHATWSAHLAARVWTITATAERNGREPLAFLTAYLEACATAGGKAPEGPTLEEFSVWRGDPDGGEAAGHPDDDPGGEPHTGALP